MNRLLAPALLLLASLLAPGAAWADDEGEGGEKKPPLPDFEGRATEAPAEVVAGLKKEFADAYEAGLGQPLIDVLGRMSEYSNPEFEKPALDVLKKFKLSKDDRKRIKKEAFEGGERDAKDIAQRYVDFEIEVLCHAVRVASNFDSKGVKNALRRSFMHKGTRKDKTLLAASCLLGLGRLGDDNKKVVDEAEGEFRKMAKPILVKAAIRYFGHIKTRKKGIVRALCDQLKGPAPGNVNSPTNPPASYWQKRWEQWEIFRRDVVWALKEITGQEWKFEGQTGPDDGDHKKALEYIKEHERELKLHK